MIRAVMILDASGQLTGCELRGHSGYAEQGSDIVCAAVSALSITCANSLEALCGLKDIAECGEDGQLSIRIPPEAMTPDAQLLLQSLRLGMEDIAGTYPRYVKFSIRKEGTKP